MPSIKKIIPLVLSALFGASSHAEIYADLGSDTRGNRWTMASNRSSTGTKDANSVLQVEFPKSRHFRNYHHVRIALLSVSVHCEKRDVAIEHLKLRDATGAEVANLSAGDPMPMHSHLLPESIKDVFFERVC